jgi:putative DNA primase/helicase
LVDAVSLIATGTRASVSVLPARSGSNNYAEEELRKRLTSAFIAARQILVFDNISQPIASETLAAALTSEYWSDRLLGRTQEVTLRPRTMFMATGNNLTTSNEISRRCYYVQLESQSSRPWQGRTFRHPELLQYIRTERPALVRALLMLGCAWLRAGSPAPTTRVIGSYEEWCRTIGGILEFAGIHDFLANLQHFYASVDPAEAAWEAFHLSIESAFGAGKFTATQLVERIRTDPSLRETLPGEFAGAMSDQVGDSLRRALGNAFRHKNGTRFGDQNIGIEKGGETRNKVVQWLIRKG